MLQLKYAFIPSPNPIVVTVAGAPPSVVELTVLITNPLPRAVELTEIQVQIPVGDEGAHYLSAAPALPDPVAIALPGWSASVSGSVVTLLPTSEDGVGSITDALSFSLSGITVNETEGTVPVTVTEYPVTGAKQTDSSTYVLQKQAAIVPVTNFWAEPPEITEPDQNVALYWTCSSQGAEYVYGLASDSGWKPVDCVTEGNCYTCDDGASGITTPLLTQTTTFTLEVIQTVSQGHRQVVATLETTVAVTVPYFSPDWYLDQESIGSGALARLHWLAFNADHCQVLLDGRTVDARAPTDTLRDGYAVMVPTDGARHQFTVVAWPSKGDARATLPFPEVQAHAAPAVTVGGGGTTAGAVAVTPDNQLALVCSAATDLLTVLSVETGQAEGMIQVGANPRAVAVTPDSALALVALSSGNVLAMVDIAARKVVGDPIPVGAEPSSIAITPDGALALVVCRTANEVWVVDIPARKAQGNPIPAGQDPFAIAITPDGSLALVTCMEAGTVTVIDVATLTADAQSIPAGTMPGGLAITPDGNQALVANFTTASVTMIDIPGRRTGQSIPVGTYPTDVAVVPGGRYALVQSSGNLVSVIDIPRLATVSPPIPAGSGGGAVAIAPKGLVGFSTNWNDSTVSII